ncbi:hypothetical protein PS943_04371 [Pseudomonas fluorescens]|uniref:Uncharacterized protein n=1 Tax=Pseudomonas fluorescens TaxID=294 RepID=A0A5E7WJD6_PSEFL|nr:hypothetical protein [Pseudomonas fluorescens]VVQ35489.1 hypothetical protein PS943_04371 [Pseudomonas fluorescens]
MLCFGITYVRVAEIGGCPSLAIYNNEARDARGNGASVLIQNNRDALCCEIFARYEVMMKIPAKASIALYLGVTLRRCSFFRTDQVNES